MKYIKISHILRKQIKTKKIKWNIRYLGQYFYRSLFYIYKTLSRHFFLSLSIIDSHRGCSMRYLYLPAYNMLSFIIYYYKEYPHSFYSIYNLLGKDFLLARIAFYTVTVLFNVSRDFHGDSCRPMKTRPVARIR